MSVTRRRFEEDVMAATTIQMGSFYSEKLAVSQLRKYRENGAIPSTQALIAAARTAPLRPR